MQSARADDAAQLPPGPTGTAFKNTLQCHSLTCVILKTVGLFCGLVYRIKLNVKSGICVRNQARYRYNTAQEPASTHNNHHYGTRILWPGHLGRSMTSNIRILGYENKSLVIGVISARSEADPNQRGTPSFQVVQPPRMAITLGRFTMKYLLFKDSDSKSNRQDP